MRHYLTRRTPLVTSMCAATVALGLWVSTAARGGIEGRLSDFVTFSAPAGDRQATTNTVVDGVSAAILPNGRLVTPVGVEVSVQAPKPFGLALSPDGKMLATLN